MDQEFYRRHSMTELKDETGSSKTLSAAARRSFFRRKQKHKRSSSKDGKDLLALDAISTDSIPFFEGKMVDREQQFNEYLMQDILSVTVG